MNNVCLTGNICFTPELKQNNGHSYVSMSLAINRPKNKDGTKISDFIECIFWGKTAEAFAQYSKKGDKIGIEGSLRTNTYEKQDGTKLKKTSVYVSKLHFLASLTTQTSIQQTQQSTQIQIQNEENPFEDFASEVVIRDEDLPF